MRIPTPLCSTTSEEQSESSFLFVCLFWQYACKVTASLKSVILCNTPPGWSCHPPHPQPTTNNFSTYSRQQISTCTSTGHESTEKGTSNKLEPPTQIGDKHCTQSNGRAGWDHQIPTSQQLRMIKNSMYTPTIWALSNRQSLSNRELHT